MALALRVLQGEPGPIQNIDEKHRYAGTLPIQQIFIQNLKRDYVQDFGIFIQDDCQVVVKIVQYHKKRYHTNFFTFSSRKGATYFSRTFNKETQRSIVDDCREPSPAPHPVYGSPVEIYVSNLSNRLLLPDSDDIQLFFTGMQIERGREMRPLRAWLFATSTKAEDPDNNIFANRYTFQFNFLELPKLECIIERKESV
jgi:hypothetical protein